MEDHQDDFLKHIKEVLRNHEEDYRQGAWEQFSQQHLQAPVKAARVIPLWKKITAAAAVLAAVLLSVQYFITTPPAGVSPAIVKEDGAQSPSQKNHPATGNSQITLPVPDTQAPLTADRSSGNNPVFSPQEQQKPGTPLTASGQEPVAQNDVLKETPVLPAPPSAGTEVTAGHGQTPTRQKPAPKPFWPNPVAPGNATAGQQPPVRQQNPLFLARESAPSERENSRSKKWSPSVFISPMFGESDVNMGYGVSLGYAVNDKIKISAGVAHNKMTASRDFDVSFPSSNATLNSPAAFSASAARSLVNNDAAVPQQQLEKVNATLSGFDIPIDISYNITNRLYATAGVSGMVVVRDNALYYYKDSENQQISVENNQGILKEDKNIQVIKSSVSDAAPEASGKERTPFLGFYNVSFGYKQKITPKNNVAIEPFLKVPMKNVSDQKLNYTGMGIRLKFDF
ncbi:hypothetical protein [Niabella aurantiaca]|uniref:hypothetical protein n=1 Tax=Niabella aurantiaca TaxID=379900 RepID=UPI00037C104F|nr:hypothetical protein [Niabella aurantiaca]